MKILGKVNEWKIMSDEFTMGTPVGDIRIITTGCADTLVDMLVQAMKERKQVIIEAVEP